jgi:hypothetical protein
MTIHSDENFVDTRISDPLFLSSKFFFNSNLFIGKPISSLPFKDIPDKIGKQIITGFETRDIFSVKEIPSPLVLYKMKNDDLLAVLSYSVPLERLDIYNLFRLQAEIVINYNLENFEELEEPYDANKGYLSVIYGNAVTKNQKMTVQGMFTLMAFSVYFAKTNRKALFVETEGYLQRKKLINLKQLYYLIYLPLCGKYTGTEKWDRKMFFKLLNLVETSKALDNNSKILYVKTTTLAYNSYFDKKDKNKFLENNMVYDILFKT